ncbi:DUF2238 domain-containing protein [Candidatus Gracilibacteria bacterium]|nr:DUF2238 domain-containing protein [Candidatus Gracilibacteria bacterium]
MKRERDFHFFIASVVVLAFIWAFIKPENYQTLLLEMAPVVVGIGILLCTYTSFTLTTLVYVLIAVQIVVALIGGHFDYAHVPLFSWLQEQGVFHRNNYDKLGHFFQGLGPALLVREVLLRKTNLRRGALFNTIVVGLCLAFSALYEIFEWLSAVTIGGAIASDFIGTQGYIWDTQTDLLWALIGAISGLLLLARLHDKQLAK